MPFSLTTGLTSAAATIGAVASLFTAGIVAGVTTTGATTAATAYDQLNRYTAYYGGWMNAGDGTSTPLRRERHSGSDYRG
ncbi:MAG TPA: hypothetical protein VIM11_00970 [Tepidisphaeraceae bacterium]